MITQAVKIGLWLNRSSAEYRWNHGQNLFQLYIEEILSHAGVPYRLFDQENELIAYQPDIILNVHAGEKNEDLKRLLRWVEHGATVIAYGGLNRMASTLGCIEKRCHGPVYANIDEMKCIHGARPLRALCPEPWILKSQHSLVVSSQGTLRLGKAGEEISPARLTFEMGRGRLIRWNVDIPSTIVCFQQGRGPVYEDGIPSEDDTGGIDEGILKADDGMEVDWTEDRVTTQTQMPYFNVPYGDLWREVILQQLITEADLKGLKLPFLDYWPEGTGQVAMISHDSDFNSEEAAQSTLQLLQECGIRTTWCMIEPGYSKEMYDTIRAAGHELAFHYNALETEQGIWSQEAFSRQLQDLRDQSQASIVSNKNHYTRFEGWGELFRWCEMEGILADQTRGPSKKGNVGFPFGTAHPYYPVAWADEHNRRYDVLQIGFLTQDLEHPMLPDISVIGPFLQSVMEVRGVAHFLFHQQHIHNLEGVRDALRAVVCQAKQLGYAFWTSEEIAKWEQSRRAARLIVDSSGIFEAENLPSGAVILISKGNFGDESAAQEDTARVRFGLNCMEWADCIRKAAERPL